MRQQGDVKLGFIKQKMELSISHVTQAIRLLKHDDLGLDENASLALVDLFESSPGAAEVFVEIRPELRKRWAERKLQGQGFVFM
jgi:hypothetical protein